MNPSNPESAAASESAPEPDSGSVPEPDSGSDSTPSEVPQSSPDSPGSYLTAPVSPFRPDALEGMVALVTGGGTGIGRGIALTLAAHGADLVLASRTREKLEPTAQEIRALGRQCLVHPVDVRDRAGVESLMEAISGRFGGLNVLVNNAAGNFLARAESMSENAWRAVVEIVLNGTFNVSQAALPLLRAKGGGAVVNITTTYVRTGAAWMAHSGAAKAGVLNLTRSLAREWGPYQVRVNAVAPGLVEGTEGARRLVEAVGRREEFKEAVPLGRLTSMADVAGAVLYLASDAGVHVSGTEIVVDGAESAGGKFSG
jgi:NAD(P)-dependent dehydrogenase (short-subunit alcohol dehydrogenase family)